MVSGRLYQATIALLLVLSVSVVGAAVTYSRSQGAARVQRAVFQPENALPAPNAQGDAERAVPNAPLAASAAPAASVSPDEAGALEKQLRSYRVRLAADGTLSGQVSVFDPASGSVMAMNDIRVLFLQNGIVKARTTPGTDGVFKVALEEGMYAIVASGPRGYAAYGLQAVRPETSVVHNAAFQEITDTLQINTLAIPSRDFGIAKRLARSYIPSELLNKSNDAGSEGLVEQEGDSPPLDASPETALDGHAVSVRDGVLLGRMRRLHPQTGKPTKIRRLNAFLVQNNSVLATASVSESGFFKFQNVDPGVYSFVAAGSDGLAAFSFQAVNSDIASKDTPSELTLVSFANGGGASGSTTGSENAGAATDEIGGGGDGDGDGDGTGAPGEGGGAGGNGGGTGGGSGGGGGGVGGGGDGFLGLLGAGLGAAALGVALDDDDDNNKPSTPDQ